MNRSTLIAVACVSALIGGCQPGDKSKHVVIDDWWSVDYATAYAIGACSNQFSKEACASSSRMEVRDFEAEIVSAFAADSHCHGIKVATYQGPNQKNPPPIKDTSGYWTLLVDFTNPEQPMQKWSLIGKKPNALQGTDEPRSIARRICVALNGEGAEIEN